MRITPRRWHNESWICSIRGHVLPAATAATLRDDGSDAALGFDVGDGTRYSRCLRCDLWSLAPIPSPDEVAYLTVPPWRELDLPRRGEALEEAILDHGLGAGVALLARLEHEQDTPGDLVAVGRQEAGGRHEHRRVRVVPAGVHDVVGARLEFEVRVLGHRQGVHVAAQQHRSPATRAFEDCDQTRRRGSSLESEREPGERRLHFSQRFWRLQAELGLAVNRSSQCDRLAL